MSQSSHKKDEAEKGVDLKAQQADFFEEYFKKGAELIRALVAENEELRDRLDKAEATLLEASRREASVTPESAHSGASNEVEREHYELACLFVAQGQLARAQEAREVVGVIAEILLNFVGADRFGIYVADGVGGLHPLFAADINIDELPAEPPRRLREAFDQDKVVGDLIAVVDDDEPAVALPLRCGEVVFGAVAVWRFLGHKSRLAAIDRRLFSVVSDAGGAALESARVRAQEPTGGRPDRHASLARLLGLKGRYGG